MRNTNQREVGGLAINTKMKFKVKEINWRKKRDFNVAKNYTVMTKGKDTTFPPMSAGLPSPSLSQLLRPKPPGVLSPQVSYICSIHRDDLFDE